MEHPTWERLGSAPGGVSCDSQDRRGSRAAPTGAIRGVAGCQQGGTLLGLGGVCSVKCPRNASTKFPTAVCSLDSFVGLPGAPKPGNSGTWILPGFSFPSFPFSSTDSPRVKSFEARMSQGFPLMIRVEVSLKRSHCSVSAETRLLKAAVPRN